MRMAKKNKPSWKFRRRAVFGSLVFAAAVVTYVLIRWDDTSLAQTAILSAFGLMGAIVASYIGGAVYEDVRLPQPLEPTKPKDDKMDDFDDSDSYEVDEEQ